MNHEKFLNAMALKVRQGVPRWYSLAPLHNPPGLELVIHFETWQRALSLCENFINPKDFQTTLKKDGWVSVKFPFPAGMSTITCKSLQRTLSVLFEAIDYAEKDTHPTQLQLMACGILRSVDGLKGYLLDTYVSYEMKCLLRKNPIEAAKLATDAMRSVARRFHFPTKQTYFGAFVEQNGFLYFGIGDGSGSLLATDFRDKEEPDAPCGYTMTSDNIDCPALQLIFFYAFAAVSAWGEKQLSVTSST